MWYCYILESINSKFKNHTYVGITTDYNRRLLQHNGDLSGGAKSTRMKKPWKFLCIVSGFSDRSSVSSFECQVKTKSGIDNRLDIIKHLIDKNRLTIQYF